MALGFDVLVQQDLLAGDVGVLVELRRRPVVEIGDGTTAVDPILLTLDATAVVPPLAAAGGHRQGGLLGAGLGPVKDLLAQWRKPVGLFVGIGVLGLEVGDHLGIGLVTEPLVRVDEHVAVVLAPVVDAFGNRRGAAHLAPIQSVKVKPEMRSYASM